MPGRLAYCVYKNVIRPRWSQPVCLDRGGIPALSVRQRCFPLPKAPLLGFIPGLRSGKPVHAQCRCSPGGCAGAIGLLLVSVGVGLEGTIDLYADILGLLGRQLGDNATKAFNHVFGYFLVQMLRQ